MLGRCLPVESRRFDAAASRTPRAARKSIRILAGAIPPRGSAVRRQAPRDIRRVLAQVSVAAPVQSAQLEHNQGGQSATPTGARSNASLVLRTLADRFP